MKIDNIGAIAVDLDGTIVALPQENGEYTWIYDLCAQYGVPCEDAREAYDRAKGCGFGSRTMILELARMEYLRSGHQQLMFRQAFHAWVRDALIVFDDAREAIAQWMREGIPVYVVTTGDRQFQQFKLELAGISVPSGHVLTVLRDEYKTDEVEELASRHPGTIVVVDDKASVLDLIRDANIPASLETIQIVRHDGKYASQEARHDHLVVTALTDIQISTKGAAA